MHRFYGGACEWAGCPRLSLGWREAQWIRWWDRTEGRLSATELLRMPMLLVDAFDVLDELQVQKLRHEEQRRKGASGPGGEA